MRGLVVGLMAAGYSAEGAAQTAEWIERHAELLAELLCLFDAAPELVQTERGGRLYARAVADTRRLMSGK